jgi:hypothetical protein
MAVASTTAALITALNVHAKADPKCNHVPQVLTLRLNHQSA